MLGACPGSFLFLWGHLKQECFEQIHPEPFKLSNKELLWSKLRQYLATWWERSCETSYIGCSHSSRLRKRLNQLQWRIFGRRRVRKIIVFIIVSTVAILVLLMI